MTETATITARVPLDVKIQADKLFAELGMDIGDAVSIFIRKALNVGGLPFEVYGRAHPIKPLPKPIELNDGYGSYICEYGFLHDYSKFDFDALEAELNDPNTKSYTDFDEMIADLDAEELDDDEI